MAEIELREVPLFSEMDEQEVAGIRDIYGGDEVQRRTSDHPRRRDR